MCRSERWAARWSELQEGSGAIAGCSGLRSCLGGARKARRERSWCGEERLTVTFAVDISYVSPAGRPARSPGRARSPSARAGARTTHHAPARQTVELEAYVSSRGLWIEGSRVRSWN